jgi:SAM-dependent methyltransferase
VPQAAVPTLKVAPVALLKRAASSTIRQVVHASYDGLDRALRTADPLVPPRAINPNIGFTPRRGAYAAEFIESGQRIADMLVSYADLQPTDSVLDVGCGIGRVARALTTCLSPTGRYRGFDVDPQAVAWCRRAYRSFENFSFDQAAVGYVNVKGDAPLRGEEFVFPSPDGSFDVAFSVSVYTHLSRAITEHYLSETSRVLRAGGVCVNTFFVIDEFAAQAMRSGRADRSYVAQGDGTYLFDPDNPNLGIGFTPEIIDSLHGRDSLSLVPPPRLGSWSGRTLQSFVYQDVVVARKTGGVPG